jgi:hypothetical protein
MINEVDADTPGSDTAEFIELYDGGTGHTPLDGMVVVLYDGGTTGSGNQSYAAFDLDGYTTDAHGEPVVRERFHWVACEAALAAWALHRATGHDRWASRYAVAIGFLREHHVDTSNAGAWWHELSETNERIELTWVGSPDVYHALQTVLLPSLDLAPGLAAALAASEQPRS